MRQDGWCTLLLNKNYNSNFAHSQRRRSVFDIGAAKSTEHSSGDARGVRGHAPPGFFLFSTINFLRSGGFIAVNYLTFMPKLWAVFIRNILVYENVRQIHRIC